MEICICDCCRADTIVSGDRLHTIVLSDNDKDEKTFDLCSKCYDEMLDKIQETICEVEHTNAKWKRFGTDP